MREYKIDKGVNRPVKLFGCCGDYLGIMLFGSIAGVFSYFVLSAIFNELVSAIIAIVIIIVNLFSTRHLSVKYGVNGFMQLLAHKSITKGILNNSRIHNMIKHENSEKQ